MPTLSTIYTAKPAAQDVKAVTLTHTTAAIANQASEDYNFVVSNMSQLLEVSCDVDCRVILYGSSAGRAADTRAYNDYNNDNSIVNSTNLLFDVVLTAGTQNVNNVFLTNREGSNRSTIYAKIFNLSGASSAVQVGLKVVQFGFENDFHLINVQTADCTANDGEFIPCDTSGGAFTVTTPASGRFKVIDVAGNASTEGFGANNLTIEAAAGTTIMGDAVLNLDVGAISPEFQLIGTDWRITNSNYGGVVSEYVPPVTREILTADRTYYVRTDGSDSNDGLSDTAGGAFLTIQKALNIIGGLDINIYNVTVSIMPSTYEEELSVKQPVGAGIVYILGNGAIVRRISISNCQRITIEGLESSPTSLATAISISSSTNISLSATTTLTAGGTHVFIGDSTVYFGDMSSSGNGYYLISARGSYVGSNGDITWTVGGSPTFQWFSVASNFNNAIEFWKVTFSGSFTGNRQAAYNSTIRFKTSAPGSGSNTVTSNSDIVNV